MGSRKTVDENWQLAAKNEKSSRNDNSEVRVDKVSHDTGDDYGLLLHQSGCDGFHCCQYKCGQAMSFGEHQALAELEVEHSPSNTTPADVKTGKQNLLQSHLNIPKIYIPEGEDRGSLSSGNIRTGSFELGQSQLYREETIDTGLFADDGEPKLVCLGIGKQIKFSCNFTF
jgi:hypothetical protein